jgi:hypothetical protein
MDATSWGTGVVTTTPSPARSRPARALLMRGTVPSDTVERSSGYSTDTVPSAQPVAKVSSWVMRSSTAGTMSVPRSMGKPDLPSTWVRSQ